eukprot:GILJ01009460.1.p1 GENE.GILJ01009460.1~~GILJ01009460.1.p1  ORF type:complete len:142 (-),score=14.16 GILJ01009460.1:287-712(-)
MFKTFVLILAVSLVVSTSGKRPSSISKEVWCATCRAVVNELNEGLKGKAVTETNVLATLADICDWTHFRTYEYPPPQMVDGCHAFLDDFEEKLEQTFLNYKDEAEKRLCYGPKKPCDKVDVTALGQERPSVGYNGIPQEEL